jgi:hypothetical protein
VVSTQHTVGGRSKPNFVSLGMSPFCANERQTLKSHHEAPPAVLAHHEALPSRASEVIRAAQSSADPA